MGDGNGLDDSGVIRWSSFWHDRDKQAVEKIPPVDVVQCGMWKRDGRDGLVE